MFPNRWSSFAFVAFALVAPLLKAQTAPTITAAVNAASYVGASIAPGEMIVIFGSNLGPAQLAGLAIGPDGRLTTTLSGARVLFDGTPAPLVYASATQISAMVPFGVAGRPSSNVQVSYNGILSAPVSVPLKAAAPGVFSADASGRGQGAITNADGTLNGAANPAAPGNHINDFRGHQRNSCNHVHV
jgi:uncharacterized protein (TIGR03437 family)